MSDGEDGVEERLEAVEEQLASLQNSHEAYRDHVVKPRLDELEAGSDDARAERAELRATVNGLQDQVARLQAELESIAGLSEEEQSSPDKRVADLRQAMIRRARSREDVGNGKIAMWYGEVKNLFADLGHGTICKPDCYKAMEQASEAAGFKMGTKTNENGRDVKAILVNTDELPALNVSSDATTGERVSTTESAANQEVGVNSD